MMEGKTSSHAISTATESSHSQGLEPKLAVLKSEGGCNANALLKNLLGFWKRLDLVEINLSLLFIVPYVENGSNW